MTFVKVVLCHAVAYVFWYIDYGIGAKEIYARGAFCKDIDIVAAQKLMNSLLKPMVDAAMAKKTGGG